MNTLPSGQPLIGFSIETEDFVPRLIADVEQEYILKTLTHTQGNKYEAARLLGFTVKTLYNKLHFINEKGAGNEYTRVRTREVCSDGITSDV